MSSHVFPVRHYIWNYFILLLLLAATVWVAKQELGMWATVVAMGIAIWKAMIVAMNFMHLRQSSKLTHLWAAAGALFLMFMFGLAMSDYLSRWFVVPGW